MNGKMMWCMLAASLVAVGQTLASTYPEPVDLTTLTGQAEGAYLAEVTSVSAHLDERGRLESSISLKIERSLFGSLEPGEQATVLHEGGEGLGRIERSSDEPIFYAGERVLVFLEPTDEGDWQVVGHVQGKLTVQPDPHTGRDTVRATGSLLQRSTPPPGTGTAPMAPDTLPLAEATRVVLSHSRR